MHIAVYDSWNGKFTRPMVEHWQKNGHTVAFNPKWDEMEKADVSFFYPTDNGIITASKEKYPHKGKIVVNCIDIDVWSGHATAVDWSYVDTLLFISPYIRDYVVSRIETPPVVKVIKPGIDVGKFSLRPPVDFTQPIRRIAYVVGDRRIWDVKRFDIALMMLRDLLDSTKLIWQLHILGSYSGHIQYNDYCDHLIDDLKLRDFIVWYDRQESVSTWLDDKDYFILPSTKEAFSYATAEAMAKGIKPIIGNWHGASDTWGPYVNKTHGQMFRRFIEEEYRPEEYRSYVETLYDQERYFKELDECIGIS